MKLSISIEASWGFEAFIFFTKLYYYYHRPLRRTLVLKQFYSPKRNHRPKSPRRGGGQEVLSYFINKIIIIKLL